MDPLMLTMRVIHVLLGAFWAGAIIFSAVFLIPAIKDAGPEGAKVAAGLQRRRMMDVMPAVGVLTILSGVWLLFKLSGGFGGDYMGSGPGMSYSLGMVLSIVALVIGLTVLRPSMLRAAGLSQAAAQAQPAERDAHLAQAQELRARAAKAGQIVALLLGLTVVTMALGRYL